MVNISAIVAGVVFVTLAATNVVVMLEATQSSRSAAARTRLIAVNRAGGYLFVILFSVMAYVMSQRLASLGAVSQQPSSKICGAVQVGQHKLLKPNSVPRL